jgi:hypothetical protein
MREHAHYFDFSAESVEGFNRKKWILAAALWASAYGLAIVRSLARFLFQACAPSGGRRLCFSKPHPRVRKLGTLERASVSMPRTLRRSMRNLQSLLPIWSVQ